MPWLPNESSSIIGKNTCVHDQGTVSSEPRWRHTDRFLPTFLLSDFMITTHNICLSHWSGKLNPCKILSLCAGIFTFGNYFRLIACRETRPLMAKFLILSIIYFQCMLGIGWLLRAFLGMMIGLVVIAAMPFPWHGFPDLLSVISCFEMWHFHKLIYHSYFTLSSEKQVGQHYSLNLLDKVVF